MTALPQTLTGMLETFASIPKVPNYDTLICSPGSLTPEQRVQCSEMGVRIVESAIMRGNQACAIDSGAMRRLATPNWTPPAIEPVAESSRVFATWNRYAFNPPPITRSAFCAMVPSDAGSDPREFSLPKRRAKLRAIGFVEDMARLSWNRGSVRIHDETVFRMSDGAFRHFVRANRRRR